jgi:hypothetical protein
MFFFYVETLGRLIFMLGRREDDFVYEDTEISNELTLEK